MADHPSDALTADPSEMTPEAGEGRPELEIEAAPGDGAGGARPPDIEPDASAEAMAGELDAEATGVEPDRSAEPIVEPDGAEETSAGEPWVEGEGIEPGFPVEVALTEADAERVLTEPALERELTDADAEREVTDADAGGAPVGLDARADETLAEADTEGVPMAPPAEPGATDGQGLPPRPVVEARPRTAARYVADVLRSAGVRFAFTVPGESFLPLLESLGETGIKVIATRHEASAAFMAEAYGQLTGRPAAILATRAVGASNLAIGLHTARQDSTPLFAIIGQVERRFRGREAFQEADQVESFGRLAKWAVEVDRIAALPEAMEEAVRRALTGRPGPVLISLPEDLLEETVADTATAALRRTNPPPPDHLEIRRVLQLLTSARRPVILAGGGVLRARATSDLVRTAELLEVPVVAAWRRPDVFPNDHRLYLGVTGYGAAPTVRERLEAADALLVLGCRLSEVASFEYAVPRDGLRWAHVDLEPRRAGAGLSAPTIAISADARTFLRAIRERLVGAVHDAESLDARRVTNGADRERFESASVVDRQSWDGPGVHPGRVIAALGRTLPADAIITTDAGNFSGWAARGYRHLRPGTFVGPTSGAMGYGLPAAIGAALVHRDRPVVALAGDGGFAMLMAELETAVRERVRVIALVFDNQRFGMIRSHQDLRGERAAIATDLGPIDFASVARACGAHGVRVEDDSTFETALREALVADRPTVIHLALDRRWGSVAEALDG